MFQSQLDESFIAHQYIIAAQAALERRYCRTVDWGCGGGSDTISTITKDAHLYGPSIAPVSTITRSATSSTKRTLSWRFYASQYGSSSSGGGGMWSAIRPIKHIRYGPDWKKT